MLYRAVLFTFAPTAIELLFVVALLAAKFSPVTAGLVAATFVLYVTWTLALTQVGGLHCRGDIGGSRAGCRADVCHGGGDGVVG